jgi:hypothetical protein
MSPVNYSTITAKGEVSSQVSTLGISVSIISIDRISSVQRRATEQLRRMKALKQFLDASAKEATVEIAADKFDNVRFRHDASLDETTGRVSIETIAETHHKGLFHTQACAIAALSAEKRAQLENIVKKLNWSIVQRAASVITPVDIFATD